MPKRSLVTVARRLSESVEALRFGPPVTHVYNPLAYARRPHRQYLTRYGRGPKEVLLLGMNPGPFGMAQTGVPFGAVSLVRDWMGIRASVDRPAKEHPARPIEGFALEREEVSGARLWGFARDRFGPAGAFFSRFFVWNYCPLCFLEKSGRNRTPDKLPARERGPLFEACDEGLREAVEALAPRLVVAVGGFAEERARAALGDSDVTLGRILHPSPASPAANRGWAEQAERQLEALGVAVGDTA